MIPLQILMKPKDINTEITGKVKLEKTIDLKRYKAKSLKRKVRKKCK